MKKIHIWPMLTVRALLAFTFGILTLTWPDVTLYVLVVLFGAWCLVDGVSLLVSTIRAGKGNDRRWAEVFGAVAGIGVGVLALVWPGLSALALTILIGLWLVMTGAAEIFVAVRWRRVLKGEWILVLSGFVAMIFGFVLFVAPVPGALVLSEAIGFYAIVYAGLLGALAIRMHRWERDHEVIVIHAAGAPG